MTATQHIKDPIRSEEALYERFCIYKENDSPDNYNQENSQHGNGKYPPDWDSRKNAIWWLQDDTCGRCGRNVSDSGHVHHVQPLSKGGTNDFDNLIGLCTDCHRLMHPDISDLNGSLKDAPPFPCPRAEPEVAVIKKNRDIGGVAVGLEDDLTQLFGESKPKKNYYPTKSNAVCDLDAPTTKKLSEFASDQNNEHRRVLRREIETAVIQKGHFPKNQAYEAQEFTINTPIKGFLTWFTDFEPTVYIEELHTNDNDSCPALKEEQSTEKNNSHQFRVTHNVTSVTVAVTDGDGEVHRKKVQLTDNKSVHSVDIPVSRPTSSKSYAKSLFGALLMPFVLIIAVIAAPVALLLLLVAGAIFMLCVIGLAVMIPTFVGVVGWALFFDGSWEAVANIAVSLLGTVLMTFITGFYISLFE